MDSKIDLNDVQPPEGYSIELVSLDVNFHELAGPWSRCVIDDPTLAELGLSADEMEPLFSPIFKRFVPDGLCLLLRHQSTQQVVGYKLGYDFVRNFHWPARLAGWLAAHQHRTWIRWCVPTVLRKAAPINVVNRRGVFRWLQHHQIHPRQSGRVAHGCGIGVLPAHRGQSLAVHLDRAAQKLAQQRGYRLILIPASHARSRRLFAERLDYQEDFRIRPLSWANHRQSAEVAGEPNPGHQTMIEYTFLSKRLSV